MTVLAKANINLTDRVFNCELEEWEVDVKWPPACEKVSPGAKERPLMEDIT
jgi:hypothetical protein